MEVRLLERDGARIVECVSAIRRSQDALELIAAGFEQGSTRLLLESDRLPAAFFELRSGFAGEFLQKLQNYRMRLACVLPAEDAHGERFREFLSEARRGRSFRAFASRADAEAWLAEP